MSIAAAFARTALVSDIDSAEAMAAPASKKARVEEPKPFHELNVENMTLKVVDGKSDKFYIAMLDNKGQRESPQPSRTWQRTGAVPRGGGRADEGSLWQHRGDV